MAISYNKLWNLLVDKKMSKADLRKKQKVARRNIISCRRVGC